MQKLNKLNDNKNNFKQSILVFVFLIKTHLKIFLLSLIRIHWLIEVKLLRALSICFVLL